MRLEVGVLPVCSLKSAFCLAMAAAASGNSELMVLGSRPELRLAPGEGGGLAPNPKDDRVPSMLSLLMASLSRVDMGSVGFCQLQINYCAERKRAHTLFAKVGGRQNTRHGVALCHLLQNLNEETDLNLRSLLQKSIQGSSALGFTQHAEPLLDGAELIFEVLIQSCRCHVLKRRLVLVNVGDPLLRCLVCRIVLVAELALAEIHLTGGANAAVGQRRRSREGAHVGRGAQVVAGVHGAR